MRRLSASRERTWKANLLVPVQISAQAEELYPLLKSIAAPKGFVRMVGLTGKRNYDELTTNLPELAGRFQSDSVFSNWTVIDAGEFGENLAAGIEALGSVFFRSNVIFLRLPQADNGDESEARPTSAPVRESELRNVVADAAIRLRAVVSETSEKERALQFLEAVRDTARIPGATTEVAERDVDAEAPGHEGSLTVYPVTADAHFDQLREITARAGSSCLFTVDSGKESALA